MKNRIVSLIICALTLSTAMPGMKANAEVLGSTRSVQVAATTQNGWVQISGKWYYYENNKMVKGWKKINGYWYYFDATSGYMKTGWQQINGLWYYFYNGGSMATGWVEYNGHWYYLDPTDGYMKTGWQQIGGKWYYFYDGGSMAKGWVKYNGNWYYTDPVNGDMKTGWQTIDGKLYYFWPSSGSMATNTTIDGKYLGSDGAYVGQTFGDQIVNEAAKHLGKPYVWGAKGPNSFDCSGFIQYVFGQLGVYLPAPTTTQVTYGTTVSYSNLQKGDLVFFNDTYDGPNPTHVGIYVGNGTMIHCGDNGVEYRSISSGYWYNHYATARRIRK